MASTMPRGRPRAPAPVHMVAMRELTAAMRQIRIAATGDNIKNSVALLNQTISWLYADQTDTADHRPFRPSNPRPVNDRYLEKVELGHHSRLRQAAWLRDSGLERDNKAHASRVPPWLVRAYDVAFGADGYLVDVYRWARQMQQDGEHNPPATTACLPAHIPPGGELDYLMAGFTSAPEVHRTLAAHAAGLRERSNRPATASDWIPSKRDGSGNLGDGETELPEGSLVQPGGYLLARWVLHNTGAVPWTDRLLYRVNGTDDGIHAPPFLPLPDTAPGGVAEIQWPLRAPTSPGTYRLCLKMGWPNGVYCFPTTLLGLIITLIVPPNDMIDPHRPWSRS